MKEQNSRYRELRRELVKALDSSLEKQAERLEKAITGYLATIDSPGLGILVREIQKQYEEAEDDYYNGERPAWQENLKRQDICHKLINKINEIYQTKYELKKSKANSIR